MVKKYFGSNHLYKAGLAMATFLMVMGIALHLGNSELSSAQYRDSSYSPAVIDDYYDDGYDDHGETGDHADDFYADCEAVGDCDEGPDHDYYGTDPYYDDNHHPDGGDCHDEYGNAIPCENDEAGVK